MRTSPPRKTGFTPWLLCIAASFLVVGCSNTPAKVRIASGPPYALNLEPTQQHIQPTRTGVYTVQPGDTLWAVAVAHAVDPEELAAWNHIHNPELLFVGQGLHVRDPDKNMASSVHRPQMQQAMENHKKKVDEEITGTEKPSKIIITEEKIAPRTFFPAGAAPTGTASFTSASETMLTTSANTLEERVSECLLQNVASECLPEAVTPKEAEETRATVGTVEYEENPSKTTAFGIPIRIPIKDNSDTYIFPSASPQKNHEKERRKMEKSLYAQYPSSVPQQNHTKKLKESGNNWILKKGKPKRWIWPLKGRIIASFGSKGQRRNTGIDIATQKGTPIRATADGVVAYADDALASYGNLILLRHGGSYMSAYAHNDKNLVQRGDLVRAGEIIALAGQSGRAPSPRLHFELRKKLTPLNPMRYLPKRRKKG